MTEQTRVTRYEWMYPSQSQERFAADAAQAAQHGWHPTGQSWKGQGFVVTHAYDQQPSTPFASKNSLEGGLDGAIMPGIAIGPISLGISMATSALRRRSLYRIAFVTGMVGLGWSRGTT